MDDQLSLHETVERAVMDEPLCVEADTTIADVLALLQEKRVGSCLVCRDGKLVGIFTERDVLKLLASGANLDRRIDKVMVPDPETAAPGDTVAEAIKKMSRGGYRRLPVVDEAGQPLGVVKISGVVHFLVEHFPKTVYNLPPDPGAVMHEREGA